MKIITDGPCKKCGKIEVKRHAKNMCKNCYMDWYRNEYKPKQAEKLSTHAH